MLEPRIPTHFEPNVMPLLVVLLVLLILFMFMFMSMNQRNVLQTQLPDWNARPAEGVAPCPIVLAFRAFEVSVTLPTEQFAWCRRSLAPRTCSLPALLRGPVMTRCQLTLSFVSP